MRNSVKSALALLSVVGVAAGSALYAQAQQSPGSMMGQEGMMDEDMMGQDGMMGDDMMPMMNMMRQMSRMMENCNEMMESMMDESGARPDDRSRNGDAPGAEQQ